MVHYNHGKATHPDWTDPRASVSIITARADKLARAAAEDRTPEADAVMVRRAMQLAGLCIRFVVDHKLTPPEPLPIPSA